MNNMETNLHVNEFKFPNQKNEEIKTDCRIDYIKLKENIWHLNYLLFFCFQD